MDYSNAVADPLPREQWLPWAQTAVGVHVVLSLLLFVVGIPQFFQILVTPCVRECQYFLQLKTAEIANLHSLGWTLEDYALYQIGQEFLYLITFSLVSAVIFAKLVRQRDTRAWYGLLAAFGLISIGTILLSETSLATNVALGGNWQVLYEVLKGSAYVAFMAFCILFPDGRFVPPWTRWLIIASIVWMATWIVLPIPALDPAESVGIYLSMTMLALMLAAQIYRYRRVSTATERQQTKWFIFGFGVVLASIMLWSTLTITFSPPTGAGRLAANLFGQGLLALFPVVFAACIGISLLRYRLWDIDIIVNRTLVYAMLTALMVALYALIVSGLGRLFHTDDTFAFSLLATGVIAVLFQPLRGGLQSAVNRRLFGERDDPARVLTRLTDQLEAHAGESLLDTLVGTVAVSLRLPYVAIRLPAQKGGFAVAAQVGKRPTHVETFPLLHQQDAIGELEVGLRSPGEALSTADHQLLGSIALLTAATVRTIQLTDEVQEARVRTVSAREEERRRLRRDLHDGLGPMLAGQGLKLGAARQLLRTKPEVAERLLDEVISQSENTVTEVRRLVYALRPPTLDEFGLVQAIREHVEALRMGIPLKITLNAPDDLPDIPAAVEVAAFRVFQEALNNVVRHAQAQECIITIQVGDSMEISIQDDGVGLAADRSSGVGLVSMRERAAEVGGVCRMESRSGHGVCVRLSLPLPNGDAS